MKNLSIVVVLLAMMISCGTKEAGKLEMINGYEYSIVKKGAGDKVKPGDIVYFDVDIVSPTDSVLQSRSSFQRRPSMVIPKEGEPVDKNNPIISLLALTTVGDSLYMIMPSDSMKGAPPIMKSIPYVKYQFSIKETINKDVYDAEEKAKGETMKSREGEAATMVAGTIANYKSGKSTVVSLDNGLEYILHEEGKGEFIKVGEKATVNYYGALLSDGKMFDNSFKRGQEFSFPLGQGRVIKGWDQAVAKLRKGSKATLIIPGELGYGKAGSPPNIPGDATLVFYVEVN